MNIHREQLNRLTSKNISGYALEKGSIVDRNFGVTNGGSVFCRAGARSLFKDFSLLAVDWYFMP